MGTVATTRVPNAKAQQLSRTLPANNRETCSKVGSQTVNETSFVSAAQFPWSRIVAIMKE
jgi:hypothetical protein